MTVTVLSDIIMSHQAVSAGVRGKQMYRNDRVSTDSGKMDINGVWTRSLREYEIGYIPMRLAQWEAITALHEVTRGGLYGFLMADPADFIATVNNGRMSLVSGSTYQLCKRYSVENTDWYHDRTITRPKAGGFTAYYDGSPISGTLDTETGRITLASAVEDVTLLSWSGWFYVPVHFMNDVLDWDMRAPGSADQRFVAGPSTMLKEIRE